MTGYRCKHMIDLETKLTDIECSPRVIFVRDDRAVKDSPGKMRFTVNGKSYAQGYSLRTKAQREKSGKQYKYKVGRTFLCRNLGQVKKKCRELVAIKYELELKKRLGL